jgi:hypothetical protein
VDADSNRYAWPYGDADRDSYAYADRNAYLHTHAGSNPHADRYEYTGPHQHVYASPQPDSATVGGGRRRYREQLRRGASFHHGA